MRMLRLLQVRGRPEVDHPPLVEHHHAVGHLAHQVQVVRHHDRSQLELSLQAQHEVRHVVRHDGVHHGRRLVVQNALRLSRQRPRNGHRALVARRDVVGIGVGVLGQVHHLEQPVNNLVLVGRAVILPKLQREQDVLGDRERIEKRPGLEHHGHFPPDAPQFRLRKIRDVLVRHDHAAAVRLDEAHDVAERHRLAHAAAADDGHRLPRINIEVHID